MGVCRTPQSGQVCLADYILQQVEWPVKLLLHASFRSPQRAGGGHEGRKVLVPAAAAAVGLFRCFNGHLAGQSADVAENCIQTFWMQIHKRFDVRKAKR